jgi:hypothetical protein
MPEVIFNPRKANGQTKIEFLKTLRNSGGDDKWKLLISVRGIILTFALYRDLQFTHTTAALGLHF